MINYENLGLSIGKVRIDNVWLTKTKSSELEYKFFDHYFLLKTSDKRVGLPKQNKKTEIDIYSSPEYLSKKEIDPLKADIYCLGIIALELMGISKNDIMGIKEELSNLESVIGVMYLNFINLLRQLLNKNPDSRPNLQEILIVNIKNPFLFEDL